MTKQEVLALIAKHIIKNENGYITATILKPILDEIVLQPNILIGQIETLNTTDKSNLVNAINSIVTMDYSDLVDAVNLLIENDIKQDDDIINIQNELNVISSRSYINPNDFVGTDTEKIQQAFDISSIENRPILISNNEERKNSIWIIEEAIKVNSNTICYFENVKLKLSDSSRDNMFRSGNSGIGITDVLENRLSNIRFLGIGTVVFEGADNPRATGDNGKTLSLNSSVAGGVLSYGSDAGKEGEFQKGDWRNIMVLMACVDGFSFENINIKYSHMWSISMELCNDFKVDRVHIDNPIYRNINGVRQFFKNLDGINVRNSGEKGRISNISGKTGDDIVALTSIPSLVPYDPGEIGKVLVTGGYSDSSTYNIRNIIIENISGDVYTNHVRLLNVLGAKIEHVIIDNIIDTADGSDTIRSYAGACVLIGDYNASYGGVTPLGDTKNIIISNVISKNANYLIKVDGSLQNSSISNIIKENSVTNPRRRPVFFLPTTIFDNVAITNMLDSEQKRTFSGAIQSDVVASPNTNTYFSGIQIDTVGGITVLNQQGILTVPLKKDTIATLNDIV